MANFESTRRSGFRMGFDNGLYVSVQWGAGTYSDNHMNFDFTFSENAESNRAEVAVIYEEKDLFIDPQEFSTTDLDTDGMVAGYLSAEQVAEIIFYASTISKDRVAELVNKYKDLY